MSKTFTPNDPIHFKMGKVKKSYYVPDDPIHFKMGKTEKNNFKRKLLDFKKYIKEKYDTPSVLPSSHNDEHLSKLIQSHPISDRHLKHVNNYTNDSYNLNHHLIGMHKNNIPDTNDAHGEFEHTIKSLDVLTNKPIKHETHLYSGIGFDLHKHFEHNEDHLKLHLPAYTSTTTNRSVADNFAHIHHSDNGELHSHILHIHMQPHDRASYIGDRSQEPSESEAILPRGTTLKLHKTPSIHTVTNDGLTVKHHYWRATVHEQ